MGSIVLAKDISFVAAVGQVFLGDWIRVDGEYLTGNIHVHCQTISPLGAATGLAVSVRTSYDTVEHEQIGTTINVTTPGSSDAPILPAAGAAIAQNVRLQIVNSEAFTMMGILSVWLDLELE